MTIQSISGKANTTTAFSTKPASAGKAKSSESQVTEKSKDNVDFTAVAKEITKAFESSKDTPAINKERVQAVKDSLAKGDYPINAEKIAAKMVQMEREQFNNSR